MSGNQPPGPSDPSGQQGFGQQGGPSYQGPQYGPPGQAGPPSQQGPQQGSQQGPQYGQPGQYGPPSYQQPGGQPSASSPGSAAGYSGPAYGAGATGQPGQPGQPPNGPQNPYGYAGGPTGPQQPKSGNAKIFIIVGAVVLALVVGAIVVGVNLRKGPGTTTDAPNPGGASTAPSNAPAAAKASDAAKAYLEALASGKADAVLATMSEQPADKTFLTDAVLAASIKAAPITDINVPEVSDEYTYSVDVTYKLGSTSVSDEIRVDKAGSGWKVSKGVIDLDLSYTKADTLPMLVNGVAVKADKIKLFPGSYAFTSGIANIDYGKENTLLIQSPSDYASPSDIKATLTAAGDKAYIAAVKANVADCLKSKKLANSGCPNNVAKSNSTYRVKDGSVKWTARADDPYANLDVSLDYKNPAIGSASIDLDLRGEGPCAEQSGRDCYVDPYSATAKVDLTKDSPTVTWSGY